MMLQKFQVARSAPSTEVKLKKGWRTRVPFPSDALIGASSVREGALHWLDNVYFSHSLMAFEEAMMCDTVEKSLSCLGIALAHETGGGLSVLVPPSNQSRKFPDLDAVGLWLASWAYTEYSEYLALQHFRDEVEVADMVFLEEIGRWFDGEASTDRVSSLQREVNSLVLSDGHDFYPMPSLIVSVLRDRVGHPYHSLGVRMQMSFEAELAKRRLAGT
ncbi:hypothetical protein [Xanthomonas vesicatoria]|nr:hypothetical protein [Xanthomonas vesicatoria]